MALKKGETFLKKVVDKEITACYIIRVAVFAAITNLLFEN